MPESELFYEISSLPTEQKNKLSENIDISEANEILEIINNEDAKVADAVRNELEHIGEAVKIIVNAFKKGGRLFYFGAGTSGRLGILDAAECPPTFGTNPEMVQGIIAGGSQAVFRAQEGAEDLPENGAKEVRNLKITPNDVVCGIAASGRTPFVKGAINEANLLGIPTILVTTIPREQAKQLGMKADVMICPDVGPEVITGSTRMKSGTAQKLVLNMLTSASMVLLGKTYGNVMIDLQLTNNKLKERARKIIMEITSVDYDTAGKYLSEADGNVKTAIFMILSGLNFEESKEKLEKSGGFIKKALILYKK